MYKSQASGVCPAKVIVTGGAGFIGSHLCDELKKDYQVYCIDDLSAGYYKNIPAKVYDVRCDITDMAKLSDLFSDIKPAIVFNQAASKKTVCDKDPRRDLEVNIAGTFNVAKLCFEHKAKLIHASTGSVYGECIGVQNENHPLNPLSYYGVSKLAGEKYVALFGTMGLNYCILRYFHVYGSRQEDQEGKGGVVAIWIKRIKQGLPIDVFGDGKQMRSFTHVKDVARANIEAINHQGIYNCASGHHYNLCDLIEALKNIYGDFEVNYKDWQPGDVKYFNVNNTKIKKWHPDWVTLKQGLKNY